MSKIHPTAIIHSKAKIHESVLIGPYCSIGENVQIDSGSVLFSHVCLGENLCLGKNCKVYPFASIGYPPQDLKYRGEKSFLEIGDNNVFREHVTINPGTKGGGMLTKIGNDCLFMVGSHVAHDCIVGSNVILANNATLAGHVSVGDYAVLGGLSAVHQFCRIGRHAMVGGLAGVENDIIPYGSVLGNRAYLSSLNIIGLRRRGFSKPILHDLRQAYGLLFMSEEGTLMERVEDIASTFSHNEPVMEIVEFLRLDSTRAICQPRNGQVNT